MTQPTTEAPLEEGTNSVQPHEAGDATRADYEGWWERAAKLYGYIVKLPPRVVEKVSMADRKNKLEFAFDQLTSPGSVSDPVPSGAAKQLNKWIEQAESFVGFLIQSYESAPPTIQAPILLKSLDEDEDWRWPWIDGWEDPKKRKKILNPSGKEDGQMKKLLIGGAVLGSAFYLGRRFMEKE